jgi:hypothetical protein
MKKVMRRARSTLGLPGATGHKVKGPPTGRRPTRCTTKQTGPRPPPRTDAASSGTLGQVMGLAERLSRFHSGQGTRPAPLTGLTFLPLPAYSCHSCLHRRTHHAAKDRSSTRHPRVARTAPDLPSRCAAEGSSRNRQEEGLPALPEVLSARDRKSRPLLSAGDPTPRN